MDWLQFVFFILVVLWYIYTIVKAQAKKRPQPQKPLEPPAVKPVAPPPQRRVAQPPPPRRVERRVEAHVEVQKKSMSLKKILNDLPNKKALVVLHEVLKRK